MINQTFTIDQTWNVPASSLTIPTTPKIIQVRLGVKRGSSSGKHDRRNMKQKNRKSAWRIKEKDEELKKNQWEWWIHHGGWWPERARRSRRWTPPHICQGTPTDAFCCTDSGHDQPSPSLSVYPLRIQIACELLIT